jgi:hypothetical protein
VAQLHDEHLTTEQLSASFDTQLSPLEQAVFDAHMSTCQQCQNNLADLRLTVVLLRALPEAEVPRSFVLPGSMAIVSERPIRQDTTLTTVPQRQRTRLSTFRRSIRVVSTLAAVLALFFIISGILPFMYSGGSGSASTATSNSTSGGATTLNHAAQPPNVHTPTGLQPQERTAGKTPTPVATQHLAPTATAQSNTRSGTPSNQTPPVPSALDLGQPVGRLSLGVLLLALSIIGLIITRRRRVPVH